MAGKPAHDNEAIYRDRSFLGHPKGLLTICLRYLCNSFSYYGFTAILIYYLYKEAPVGLGFDKTEAAQLLSLYFALVVICGVVGSYMADRVFGNRRAYRFCAITAPMYYFSFAIPNIGMLGLILYCVVGYVNSAVAGSSLYSLLGKLYAQGDKRRDGAFSVIYVLSNIGSMCPVVIGGIALVAGYQVTFFILGVIGALGSIVYLILEKRAFGPLGMEPDDPLPLPQRKKAVALLIAFFIAFGGILFLLFDFKLLTITSFANIVSVFTLILPVIYFVYILRSKKTSDTERKRLPYLIPMYISSAFAMMVWYQATTILSIYAETSVNLVFFGQRVAPSIYMTLQAIFAIAIGTLCAGIWSKMGRPQPSAAWKMGFGTMCYGLGTLLMILPFQLYAHGDKANPFWLVGFYLIVIIGEAISYPAGSASASALSPVAFSTQMMTVWGFSGTAGANLSTLASNFYHEGSESLYFLGIGGSTLLVGLILVIFSKRFAKGMGLNENAEAA